MLTDRQGAPTGSPGCFGRALSYRADTPECDSCPFAGQCEPLSRERTRLIRARMGVVSKEVTPAPKKKPVEAPATIMGLSWPKKVVELVARWERMGLHVTETLARRENPFTTTPAFMRVACHVLLSKPEGASRRYLTACLMHKFGWPETTAAPQAAQALQALCAIGAARELPDGNVTLLA